MRGYFAAAIVGDGVGIKVIHGPVPAPLAAGRFRRIPRHVVDHYLGGCRGQRLNVRVNEAFAAGVQRHAAEGDEQQTFHLIQGSGFWGLASMRKMAWVISSLVK